VLTSSRGSWYRPFGITSGQGGQECRSAQFRFGRRGCRRCRTASWWRRIKIPAVCHATLALGRRSSRAAASFSARASPIVDVIASVSAIQPNSCGYQHKPAQWCESLGREASVDQSFSGPEVCHRLAEHVERGHRR